MGRFECGSCGCVYDEYEGDASQDVPAGTPFEDLPDEWLCPECGSTQDMFEEIEE
jgi:rubredoxin